MTEVSDKSVDLIFTSPPYWNKRNYVEGGGLGNEKTDKEFVSNLVSHLDDCSRILKDDGSFFLVLGDTFHQSNLLNIPHRVAIGLQEKGWLLRNTIVWKKTNPKPSNLIEEGARLLVSNESAKMREDMHKVNAIRDMMRL